MRSSCKRSHKSTDLLEDPRALNDSSEISAQKIGELNTHHLTSTSSHAPASPIATPVMITINHIFTESKIGSNNPRVPDCVCIAWTRSLSKFSSCSQSIVFPSWYFAIRWYATGTRPFSVSSYSSSGYMSFCRRGLRPGSMLELHRLRTLSGWCPAIWSSFLCQTTCIHILRGFSHFIERCLNRSPQVFHMGPKKQTKTHLYQRSYLHLWMSSKPSHILFSFLCLRLKPNHHHHHLRLRS